MFVDEKKRIFYALTVIVIIITVPHAACGNELSSGKKLAILYCAKFGIKKSNFYDRLGVTQNVVTNIMDKDYIACLAATENYFESSNENKTSITKFSNYLKKNKIGYLQGMDCMINVSKYDWKMENVIDLFYGIELNRRGLRYDCSNVLINREEWFKWTFGSFNVGNCMDYFKPDPRNDPDAKKPRTILEEFKNWWSKSDNGNKNKCVCRSVFRIAEIQSAESNNKSLYDYFNEYCLGNDLPEVTVTEL